LITFAITGEKKNAQTFSPEDRKKWVKDARIKPLFENNSGRTKIIYDHDHPYFREGGKEEVNLRAEKNYGMQPIEKIYEHNSFKPAIKAASEAEAKN